MKKTILFSILALALALSGLAKAEMTISGYTEFFAGSADQPIAEANTAHGYDKAGLDNGNYGRITANYSSTLDSGIGVSGTFGMTARDCQGDKTGNCDVVNFNFVNFSGNFGVVSIGERFAAGHYMMSRMTATVPTAEPDGGVLGRFYTAGSNTYGAANEVNFAANSMKILYATNTYAGLSFAVSYDPNTSNTGQASTTDGQQKNGTTWASYNDLLSAFAKYSLEMDGVGIELVYGQQSGNAGQAGATGTDAMNDLDETAYSAKITYGGFSADYRKNDAGDSGQIKNNNAGNDEGTTVCAQYAFGNMRVASCNIDTNFTDTSNQSNSSTTRTYQADYNLGGGVTIGAAYFDVEQTANGVTDTDVDGIITQLAIGF